MPFLQHLLDYLLSLILVTSQAAWGTHTQVSLYCSGYRRHLLLHIGGLPVTYA